MGDLIFETRGAGFRYPGAADHAVRGADVAVGRGELVGVVGPNGSGKSTLVRLLLGTLIPTDGTVTTFGRPAHAWRRRDLARRVAVVSQREEPVFPLRVREAVLLGRYPHVGPAGAMGPGDHAAVDAALARAEAAHLADRWTTTLSGGEWQRVRLARALAQEPDVLVLDEPTANLDLRHEMQAFELLAGLVRDEGKTGLLVSHHVNLVARFVDRVLVLDRGTPAADGPPGTVLTRETLERLFGWPVDVVQWRGSPQVVPLRREEREEREEREGVRA
jgi:iron complex transport system ATP-binding protein